MTQNISHIKNVQIHVLPDFKIYIQLRNKLQHSYINHNFVKTLVYKFLFYNSSTLQFFFFVMQGLMMLTYQATNPNLQPPENKTPSHIQSLFLFTGLYSIAVGLGGMRATLAAHGADQLDQSNKSLISSYFSWYFFSLCTGGLLATCVMVPIEQKYGWSTSFFILLFVTSLALCTFASGFAWYRYKRPSGSPLTRIIQVIYMFANNLYTTSV